MENQENDNKKNAGIIFVGFMFIGIGIGKYIDNTAVGTLVGLGVGFLAMAIYRSKNN
jgi:putative effector of murein hydrolase LrgA (UPF0299 family)